MKNKYHPGKLKTFIEAVLQIERNQPSLSPDFVLTQMAQWYPELKKISRCPNCNGSMQMYVFKFDVLDALLLIAMAEQVSERSKTMNFTEANKVHVQSMESSAYAVRSRTTQCRMLGLVAKVKNEKGRHVGGMWSITSRGWAALLGDWVPAEVLTFQNEIVERSEKVTTIDQALKSHVQKVQDQQSEGKTPTSDYTQIIHRFSQFDWVQFGEMDQGKLL